MLKYFHVEEYIQLQLQHKLRDIYTTCLCNLALCHYNRSDFLKAKEACLKLLEADPNHIKGLLRATKVSQALHNFDDAQVCITYLLYFHKI